MSIHHLGYETKKHIFLDSTIFVDSTGTINIFVEKESHSAKFKKKIGSTSRSREDAMRNEHQNAKRNPTRNQESIVLPRSLVHFSNFQMARDLEE